MDKRGLIFDMDGVLTDTEPLHIVCWQKVLRGFSIVLEKTWYNQYIGISDVQTAKDIFDAYRIAESAEKLLSLKRDTFDSMVRDAVQPFEGVLDELKEGLGAFTLGLATSNTRRTADIILEALGLCDVFTVIVTSDDVAATKPAPDCYTLAAERMGLPASQCIAIEDSPVGIKAAKSAGLTVLAVTTTHGPESLREADLVVQSTVQAIQWVKNNTYAKEGMR